MTDEGKEKEKEKEVIGGGEEEQKEHTIGVQTHTQGPGREDGYDWIHRAPSSASQIKQKLVGGKSKANQHGESGSKEDVTPIPPVRPPSDPNKPGKNRRIVRDPVTRQDVEIADVTGREMRQADEPKVCPRLSDITLPLSEASSAHTIHALLLTSRNEELTQLDNRPPPRLEPFFVSIPCR